MSATSTAATASQVLGAVEALFGAGTSVAPMPGATLLRYLHKLQDPWTNGLHLDEAPDRAAFVDACNTWEAFERPGRIRWVVPPGAPVGDDLRAVAAERDLVLATRPAFQGDVGPGDVVGAPADVTITTIVTDIRDWAGFEVLARWIDLDEDPDVWRWRGQRVRNLVQGRRGAAVIARVPAAPVAAGLLLQAPDHRPEADAVIACVVHEAYRGRGVAAAVVGDLAAAHFGPVTVLGDGTGHLANAAAEMGLAHVADLVEVGTRPDGSARKA